LALARNLRRGWVVLVGNMEKVLGRLCFDGLIFVSLPVFLFLSPMSIKLTCPASPTYTFLLFPHHLYGLYAHDPDPMCTYARECEILSR